MPSTALYPLPVEAGPQKSRLLIADLTRAAPEMLWPSRLRPRGVPLLLAVILPLVVIITALALAFTAAAPRAEALSNIPPGHQMSSGEKEAQAHGVAAPGEEGQLVPAVREDDHASHAARQALLALPLRFVPNAGQTDPSVHFTVQGAGHTFFFTPQEIVFTAVASQPGPDRGLPYRPADPQRDTGGEADLKPSFNLVRLRFLGANPNPQLEGLEPLAGVVNYFLENDPARWRSNVPTYAALTYGNLYPGVDLVYRGTEGSLKSEFHLAPGADPEAIVMAYTGLRSLTLRADGALILETPLGQLIEEAPLIYHEVDGYRQEVQGRYAILPSWPVGGGGQPAQMQRVGFRVSGYDPDLPLVIDPVLVFSTYLGGAGYDRGHGVAVDQAGNIYVTGSTASTDFPTHDALQPAHGGGERDAFVTQITKVGGVYAYGYSTYLGGSQSDSGAGIAVDGDANVYVTGYTESSNFPTHIAIQTAYGGEGDAFVTQIIKSGGVHTLGYSTYLGGNLYDSGYGIALDGDGNPHVGGETESSNFPTHNAIQPTYGGGYGDAFVTQIITASGVYTYGYSTYLGGSDYDYGNGIAVDGDANAYVTGDTDSLDFPTHNAIQPTHGGGSTDAFVTQIISASGVYTYGYSTYLGGKNYDWGNGIGLDGYSNAYVTGRTWSSDFPTHKAVQPGRNGWGDAFVTQIISASGVYTYGYSTYLGGSNWDSGNGITVDGDGNAYVAGDTQSTDFPTHNAIQPSYGGGWELRGDAFATQIISASGVYTYGYSTYLGGTDDDYGRGIAVDGAGNAYVVGRTWSLDFPTRNAIQPTYAGGDRDAFVAIIWEPPFSTYAPLVLKNYSGR